MAKKRSSARRNPQDATLRNVRAHGKRLSHLETRVRELKAMLAHLLKELRG